MNQGWYERTIGNRREISTTFKVKLTKAARIIEFDCLQIAKAASRETLPRCDLLILETVEVAFHTLRASDKAI